MIAGLVTSVHCIAMCGPISCAFVSKSGTSNASVVLTTYHLAKLFSYTFVGSLAGLLGSSVIRFLEASWLSYIPWILVIFFFCVAFRLDRYFPKPKWLGASYRKISVQFQQLSRPVAAGLIGLATPLLPCGPLYMIFGLALFSGSWIKGAEFALGFGLGTIPLLWLAQSQFLRLSQSQKFTWLPRLQRIVAGVAALVIAWRLRTTLGIEGAEDWVCHPF